MHARTLVWLFPLVLVVPARANPIRPLAQEHVVVGESPSPATVPFGAPTILRLDSGRLIAGYKRPPNDTEKSGRSIEVLLTSDDGGATWVERVRLPAPQGRLFRAGGRIWYLATGRGMPISYSADEGLTWSAPALLTSPDVVWQQTPANVWRANGCVYVPFERRNREIDAWGASEKALVLLRAREDADLTRPQAWTFSSELVFADVVAGVRTNRADLGMIGVPFYPQSYPKAAVIATSPRRSMAPIGWAEPSVVQIVDPDHVWYDPAGRTFHLLARAHTGGTGFACLTKVVEAPDGTMTMSLERAPSGARMLYLPMPGGQMRFHVLYDPPTKLYWLLGSQAVDSMRRPDRLARERFGPPFSERHRLVLHFSRNLVDWCLAGVVAIGVSPREARHYGSMDVDGEDLVILARSGDARAKSAHDGNLITFHRVRNFRALVY